MDPAAFLGTGATTLGLAACGETAPEPGAPEAASFAKPLGVASYTIRESLKDDPAGTFARLSEIGFTEIEGRWEQTGAHLPELRAAGLKLVSVGVESPAITGNWAMWNAFMKQFGQPELVEVELEEFVARVAEAGARFMMHSYLLPPEREDLDAIRSFVDRFNAAGEVCTKAGIRLCYHNHAFEFELKDGSSAYEILVERLDPALTGFELDTFWVSAAGQDPAAWLKRLGDRVHLLHLKDLAEGSEPRYTEFPMPPEMFREVGGGTVDFQAVLAAAAEAGVSHYLIEQDETSGDPVDSLRVSYEYLRSLQI